MTKKSIAIIGGGPASMMLACSLDSSKYDISIYEKNTALGRKFLVAGKGGFNLTHSEELPQFVNRYTPHTFIEPFLKSFTNKDFRDWLKSIGIETYVGTSKRVFPIKGVKPIEVLNAIEGKLQQNNVSVFYSHEWKGWDEKKQLIFSSNNQTLNIKTDIVIFALGGASWKVTGSDGSWKKYFFKKGITVKEFYPSNCAYKINWDSNLIQQIEGQALKNCEFSCGDLKRKGEAVLTKFGIEGSGIYPLSPEIRKQLRSHAELDSASHETLNQVQSDDKKHEKAKLIIDFKPELSESEIKNRFQNKGKQSIKDFLEKTLNLSSTQIALIKGHTTKEEYNNIDILIQNIKSFTIKITDFAPIDDAISTVGGIDLSEINENLELKKLPKNYCLGEMLDWDAPTGGYLLQACFSMGFFLANRLNTQTFPPLEGAGGGII